MSKALTTKTARQLELEKLEQEINSEAFEAFYHIGQKLLKIRTKRLFEDEGFKSWGAYCASGRIDYKKRHADQVIRCAGLRPILGSIGTHDWTERQVRELCKCETDNDVQRVAKKAISLATKSGERVTARLIAQIRDGDDETGKTKKVVQSFTLDKHLSKLSDILVDWRFSLEQVEASQWDDVDPVVLTRVKNEANALLKFLRS